MQPSWRPLSSDTVAEWTNLLAEADGTEEFYEAEDLAEELSEPGVDPRLDTVGVWCDGILAGYGQLRVRSELADGQVRADLNGGVHPQWRGLGLGAGDHGPAGGARSRAEPAAPSGHATAGAGIRWLERRLGSADAGAS